MKSRILLVDDDHDIVRGTSMRLRAAGYDISTAFDGHAGLAAAMDDHPDAIVLDIRMRKKNGLEILADLKSDAETRGIPVVMLSASVGDQQAALDGGARFFVKKPFRGNQLVEAVDVAVREAANQASGPT